MRYYSPTNNLNADINNHEADMEDWLNSRPKCEICKEPIQEEWCWVLMCDPDFYVCNDCVDDVEALDDDLEEYHID